MTTEMAVTGLEMEAQVKLTHDRAAYMTVSELADLLGVHRNTVHYWIREGEVKAQRIGMARRSPLLKHGVRDMLRQRVYRLALGC